MESILLSIHSNDPLWIANAFICGLIFKVMRLPPLLGFLLAGFLLNAVGAKADDFLKTIADFGITLLLFSIGLKLKFKALAKPEVWGVASIHMLLITLLFSLIVVLFTFLKLPLFVDLDAKSAVLIGFVLSFSSTVFAIKILDELGAMSSKHGQVAIGILVIQDIAAVIFIAASSGKVPSIWAFGLLLLPFIKPLLYKLLDKVAHGELLVLFGITLALCGADIFEMVGMKGDVGALIFGMLMAYHSKTNELAKALLGFKDLFLVGFFLSVGMVAMPGWTELVVALVFIVLLPLKAAIYYGLFNGFCLRASTSWRTTLNLSNYSEFGLIVGALAASSGWLAKEWLAVFAIALAISFILSAPLINVRDDIYQKYRQPLKRFERKKRLAEEMDIHLYEKQVVIFGMGRMGTSVYNAMHAEYGDKLVGVEIDHDKTKYHFHEGRIVIRGDATSADFWNRAKGLLDDLNWVILTLPSHSANMMAAHQLKQLGYQGKISATSKFPDEEQELKEAGVDFTFNIYTEAGRGFANDLQKLVN